MITTSPARGVPTLAFASLLLACLAAGVPAPAARAQLPTAAGAPATLVVRFRDNVPAAARDRTVDALGGRIVRKSLFTPGLCAVAPAPGSSLASAVAEYARRPDVLYAEPEGFDIPFDTPAFLPDDPLYYRQWNFEQIHMPAAWDLVPSRGATSVVVAVIDTGVAFEEYGAFLPAPDLAGVAFVHPKDVVDGDTHPNDEIGHGTHVCGTIAQATHNGMGTAGMADHVAIMPVRSLGPGGGSHIQFSDAVHWAVDHGARVINYSAGGSDSATKHDAVIYAYNNNTLLIAAYGNDGASNPASAFPARYPEALGVGALTRLNTLATYSNWGDGMDVVAPGGDTTSSDTNGVIQNTFSGSPANFGFYGWQGTSMATPHVAGLAALLLAQGLYLTRQDLFDRITQTCEDLGAGGYDPVFGWGLIDARAALASPPLAPSNAAASDGAYTDKVRVTWSAAAAATGYRVFRNTSAATNTATFLGTASTTRFDDVTVAADVTCSYWVVATNPAGVSPWSAPDTGYRTLVKPPAPTGVTASKGLFADRVRVTWAAAPDASAYEVWRHTANQPAAAVKLGPDLAAAPFDDRSAVPGIPYFYWIKARNTVGASPFSTPDTGFTVVLPRALGADFDGDGLADPALYDAMTGTWTARLSTGGYAVLSVPGLLGNPAFQAAAADYDGDGRADPAVCHAVTGEWVVLLSTSGYARLALPGFLGGLGWTPAPADFDGDGLADPAVYARASGTWAARLSSGGYAVLTLPHLLGDPASDPAPADYDGDGRADPAVYAGAAGDWAFLLSSGGYARLALPAFLGGPGWTPAPADYDGDGKADPTVVNTAGGDWAVRLSASGYARVELPGFLGPP